MLSLSPCKRKTFIQNLKKLGFVGPYSGSKHQFMVFQQHRLTIPSNSDYSIPQLQVMLKEVYLILGKTIKAKEWNQL